MSQQIAVLKRMKKLLPLKLREKHYRAFIAPHFNYCAESSHFCNRLTGKLEKLNERALHFVYQDKISTYDETLVVKNGYTHEQIKELQKC